MTQKAIELTGFHVSGDALLLGGKLMKTHTLRQALQDFLDWLGDQLAEQDKVLLLAYNGQRFDVPILLDSLRKCGYVLFLSCEEIIKVLYPGLQWPTV